MNSKNRKPRRPAGTKLVSVAPDGGSAARISLAIENLASRGGRADGQSVTVAEVCRIAKISRNSLYRYHPAAVARIESIRERKRSQQRKHKSDAELALRSRISELEMQLEKTAALVDHYFAAYTEAKTLAERLGQRIKLKGRNS